MKKLVQSTLVVGLALSSGMPVLATELDGKDAVVASFYRDLNREPSRTRGSVHVREEQGRLPEIVRSALDGGDPVVASFVRELRHEPTPNGTIIKSDVERDFLPERVRAALGDQDVSNERSLVAQRD